MGVGTSDSPGLYVHTPFCRTKCPYCDFYSVALAPESVEAWLQALDTEARLYSERWPAAFDTLYLGGGTPSLLDNIQLAALVGGLRSRFAFAPGAEVTMEVNPDDITPEKLACLRDLGVNRLSVGGQSFDEEEVGFLGRRHTARQTLTALEWIRASGSFNLGLDLIYGFEGQTEESWTRTMDRALSFLPEHLSCYQMTIEEGTPFGRMEAEGRLQPFGEDRQRAFFLLTSRYLEAHGFIHYEISNFARGREHMSRHNRKYWNHTAYLGLGPSAHSFDGVARWWNLRSVTQYCRRLAEGASPLEDMETLSPEQMQLETLLLGFRTADGVAVEDVEKCGHREEIVSKLRESGLLLVRNGRLIPTREGFLVADSLPLLFSA